MAREIYKPLMNGFEDEICWLPSNDFRNHIGAQVFDNIEPSCRRRAF
jgi:hypothetical protein